MLSLKGQIRTLWNLSNIQEISFSRAFFRSVLHGKKARDILMDDI